MEGRRRLAYKLRTTKFDALMTAFHGEKLVHEVGDLMHMDPNNWSLIRSGKRDMNTHIIARCGELFPDVLLSAYAESYVKSYGEA